jgi:hypothetical protein
MIMNHEEMRYTGIIRMGRKGEVYIRRKKEGKVNRRRRKGRRNVPGGAGTLRSCCPAASACSPSSSGDFWSFFSSKENSLFEWKLLLSPQILFFSMYLNKLSIRLPVRRIYHMCRSCCSRLGRRVIVLHTYMQHNPMQ